MNSTTINQEAIEVVKTVFTFVQALIFLFILRLLQKLFKKWFKLELEEINADNFDHEESKEPEQQKEEPQVQEGEGEEQKGQGKEDHPGAEPEEIPQDVEESTLIHSIVEFPLKSV